MGFKAVFQVLKLALLLAVTGTLLSCGGNIFEPMSSKTSHDALIEEIRNLTNEQKFSEAKDIILAYPTLAKTRSDKFLFATAYAGSCGLTFAGVFTSLASASGSPMKFSKDAFTTIDVIPADCYQAQLWIESIGTAGVRTTNENIAMFIIGLAKVGTYLRSRADTDKNGSLDPGYDSCDNTKLPKADVKQIISGFGLMIENIAALGTSIASGFSTNVTNVGVACAALGLACNVTDPTVISDADADEFRDAIKSKSTTDFGIENCSISPTCCP